MFFFFFCPNSCPRFCWSCWEFTMQIIITIFFFFCNRSFPLRITMVFLLLLQAVGSRCQCSLLNCVAHAAGFAPCLPTVVSIFAHHSVNKRSSQQLYCREWEPPGPGNGMTVAAERDQTWWLGVLESQISHLNLEAGAPLTDSWSKGDWT